MNLSSSNPAGNLTPVPELSSGQTFLVDSFFDVTFDISIDGQTYNIDSFFDIEYLITPSSSGGWDTEMVSMSLSSQAPGGPSINLRESPSLPSPGHIKVNDLPDGTFGVDIPFDVFFELSVDGGAFVPALSSTRIELSGYALPEPSTMTLLGLAGIALVARRKNRNV
jgi:hypothetical protein